MGFLSIMGKIIIVLSAVFLAGAASLTILFSDNLGLSAIQIGLVLGISGFLFLTGIYSGTLGVKMERLHERLDSLSSTLEPRPLTKNLVKAVCPIDSKHVVFVHVRPHRVDAMPDGLDLFLGSCGHEVHREEIEIEQ